MIYARSHMFLYNPDRLFEQHMSPPKKIFPNPVSTNGSPPRSMTTPHHSARPAPRPGGLCDLRGRRVDRSADSIHPLMGTTRFAHPPAPHSRGEPAATAPTTWPASPASPPWPAPGSTSRGGSAASWTSKTPTLPSVPATATVGSESSAISPLCWTKSRGGTGLGGFRLTFFCRRYIEDALA